METTTIQKTNRAGDKKINFKVAKDPKVIVDHVGVPALVLFYVTNMAGQRAQSEFGRDGCPAELTVDWANGDLPVYGSNQRAMGEPSKDDHVNAERAAKLDDQTLAGRLTSWAKILDEAPVDINSVKSDPAVLPRLCQRVRITLQRKQKELGV